MKRLLILSAFLILPFIMAQAQTASVKVSWKFLNIEEDYNHISLTRIYVDGVQVAASAEAPESKGGKLSCKIPKGVHSVRIVSCAKYEGSWEEHTIENKYSIDCSFELTQDFQKGVKIALLFDLESGTTATVK